jgi:hypothetical protein
MIVVSMSGLLILGATTLILLFAHTIITSKKTTRIILLSVIIILPLAGIYIFKSLMGTYNESHTYVYNPNDKTSFGNYYDPPGKDTIYENGYLVWIYVNEGELREAWNKISYIKYDSLDERKQPIRATLVRFMASKGLKKDAEGLSTLTADERRNIERGVANKNYQKLSSIRSRLQQIVWEVDQFLRVGSSSGHSVTQRFEFWYAGLRIASDHILTGVGTGDMPQSYRAEYDRMNSRLDEAHRLRAHNQFLAITVAFGIFGLIYFVIAYFYPLFSRGIKMNMIFSAFFLISLLSMFSEDTLETQAGVTFFSFFFIFLLRKPEKS